MMNYDIRYLFLRTNNRSFYTYLGKLKYRSHDKDREKPVYFQWQIMDWNIDQVKLVSMGLHLEADSDELPEPRASRVSEGGLEETAVPELSAQRSGVTTRIFRAHRAPDYEARDATNRKIGLAGEKLVVAHERRLLTNSGRADLAEKVRHVAQIEGDGAGYDVLSYTVEGKEKYIEVKTTRGDSETGFYLTAHELAYSKQAANYYLYRVYNFDAEANRCQFFVLVSAVDLHFNLEPLQYRVSRR